MHRRHPRVDRDFLCRDVLDRRRRIEARMQDELRPHPKPEQHDDGQRINVEQRQDAENALLAVAQGGRFRSAGGLDILRAGRGQIGVREHRALGRAGRAAGILNDGQRFVEVAERMRLIAPVVVDQVAERHVAIVVRCFREHARGRHMRLDRTGGERHLGELADDELLEARRSEQLFRLRVERGEVERDQEFGLAVLDLELERRSARPTASS